MHSEERFPVKAMTENRRTGKHSKYIVVINGNKSFYHSARSLIRDMMIDTTSSRCC
jgi:hypothetical protein